MRDYTKYEIWKDGVNISVAIYELANSFPAEEKFGLVSQLRRAVVSISSNFAEGCSRTSEKEFKHFIEISLGSAFEIKTQLVISNRLGFLNKTELSEFTNFLDKVSKQLNALRNKLK